VPGGRLLRRAGHGPVSGRYMCCKHGGERVLQQAAGGGADAGRGYEVTRYIYATPDVMRGPSSASVSSSSSSWVRDGNGSGSDRVEQLPVREQRHCGYKFIPVPIPAGRNSYLYPYPSGFGQVSGTHRVYHNIYIYIIKKHIKITSGVWTEEKY
jgi:hypothetical protein